MEIKKDFLADVLMNGDAHIFDVKYLDYHWYAFYCDSKYYDYFKIEEQIFRNSDEIKALLIKFMLNCDVNIMNQIKAKVVENKELISQRYRLRQILDL